MARDKENLNRWMREYKRTHRAIINARHTKWRKTAAGLSSIQRDKNAKRRKIWGMVYAAKSKPCKDCGLKLPPELMDLDHRVSPEDRKGWAAFTLGNLAKELAKCDVRCPICHRIRHWRDKLKKMNGGNTDRKKVG